ncbi:probable thimet oligopeptidase [Impatiens glandulifera]|uniref:probable thimet oligopeptidase n=1 Tax=Impatiens glandulifera TaxID=253017 RepID=UPI001FB0D271|nr:probable thimet oligopeptidase [Impatiens glandulifera]
MEGEESKKKKNVNIIAFTGVGVGVAALLAIAVNFVVTSINTHKKNSRKKVLPGSNVNVSLSASEILRLADHIVAKSKEVHDAVALVPLDKVAYSNVIMPLAELEAKQFPLVQSCIFFRWVSTSEDVKKASAEAEKRIDAHISSCSNREDVYRVIKAFAARAEWMDLEAKQYTKSLVRDFERNGLNLTSTKREQLQHLKEQIDDLSMQYIQNLNDDTESLLFSESELVGLPMEFLKSLEKADIGKFKVSLRSHHVSPIVELCKVGSTRRIVATAYGRRCEINLSVLQNLVELRHKCSRLLGHANYADYILDIRMANSSQKVFEFLEELSNRLTSLASRELSVLKELKKKEEGDSPFGVEDLPYYVKRYEDQEHNLDFGALKEYFPVNLVLSGIFKICQDLFGLRYEEIPDADVWHPRVHLYSISDLSSGEILGYIYLDLYSREGKYAHTCVVPLQNGSFVNGARQIAVVLLISQLPTEVDGRPGLLPFSEVVNLFHEFAHVVHHICNLSSFARFSGLRIDPDFLEIPAKLLENWCYESIPLKLVSGFHQDITKPIKDEVCEKLKRWRHSFSALKLKQEVLYCLFDQIIHTTENVDMVGLFKHLHPQIMLGLPMLEGTNPASCFPRTALGYEAACYSRIWSEVLAADIFSSRFHHNLLDEHVGMQFRSKVLAQGGSKDPHKILSDFLGREPSIQAFIDSRTVLGL